jgi:hypothetical protein
MRALSEHDTDLLDELGFTTDRAWLDDPIAALVNGGPFLVYETVGPYALHHVSDNGLLNVDRSRMPKDEMIGFTVGRLMRDLVGDATNARMNVLLDDYTVDHLPRPLTTAERALYIVEMAKLLRDSGVIRHDDKPGKQFVLTAEANLVERVDDIIERLESSGAGYLDHDEGDVTFYPTATFIDALPSIFSGRRKELKRRGISIVRNGRPTCHALDASTYLAPRVSEMMQLIVLDKRFSSEQVKVHALLRAMGITTRDGHHNLYFDSSRLSEDQVLYVLCVQIEQTLRALRDQVVKFDSWQNFVPSEYVERCYGERILVEDRQIINAALEHLDRSGRAPGTAQLIADVGCGPNMFPPMLLAPYLAKEGAIDLIDPSEPNRAYMRGLSLAGPGDPLAEPWQKFEQLMVESGGLLYDDVYERTCDVIQVVDGSIYSLPRNRYDMVASFFSTESITRSRRDFWMAVRSLAASIKPDGLLVVAHMIRSHQWYAGAGTRFPALHLSCEDIEDAYRDAGLDFDLTMVSTQATRRARKDYEGACLVIARRNHNAIPLRHSDKLPIDVTFAPRN